MPGCEVILKWDHRNEYSFLKLRSVRSQEIHTSFLSIIRPEWMPLIGVSTCFMLGGRDDSNFNQYFTVYLIRIAPLCYGMNSHW